MKKLMIALAAVAMVVTSEAAVTKWKASTGSTGVIYDGYKDDGSGTYTKAGLSGATAYLIAAATDTAGVGITQAKLLEAFRGDNFSLASYAVPVTGEGVNKGSLTSGKNSGFTAVNGTADTGDFHVDTSLKYDFYLATVVTDGEGNDWLYMSDIVSKAALASTSTQQLQFTGTKTSSLNNLGTGDYAGAGWYTAVPEPTSGLLLLLGVAGLALRRRRA